VSKQYWEKRQGTREVERGARGSAMKGVRAEKVALKSGTGQIERDNMS
jgi:hypothetical protein